mgnify:CR=1 FL=1
MQLQDTQEGDRLFQKGTRFVVWRAGLLGGVALFGGQMVASNWSTIPLDLVEADGWVEVSITADIQPSTENLVLPEVPPGEDPMAGGE